MFGFPKTYAGIDIGARALRAVRIRKGKTLSLDGHASISLPEGVLAPSYTKGNIVDVKRFNELLRLLMEKAGISKGDIQVSIPDQVVKVSFMDLKEFPAKEGDVYDFIKWRSKKFLPYEPEDAKVDFQRFGGKAMAVFVKRDIVSGYEDALLSVSLRPGFISTPSLNLFNLFSRRFGDLKDFVFVSAIEDSSAVVIVREGAVDFHRSMDLGFADERFIHEANSSILFYTSENAGVSLKKGFVFVGAQDSEVLATSLSEFTGVGFEAVRVADMVEGPGGLDMEAYGPAAAAALYRGI